MLIQYNNISIENNNFILSKIKDFSNELKTVNNNKNTHTYISTIGSYDINSLLYNIIKNFNFIEKLYKS